jgi:hypothetical protein
MAQETPLLQDSKTVVDARVAIGLQSVGMRQVHSDLENNKLSRP